MTCHACQDAGPFRDSTEAYLIWLSVPEQQHSRNLSSDSQTLTLHCATICTVSPRGCASPLAGVAFLLFLTSQPWSFHPCTFTTRILQRSLCNVTARVHLVTWARRDHDVSQPLWSDTESKDLAPAEIEFLRIQIVSQRSITVFSRNDRLRSNKGWLSETIFTSSGAHSHTKRLAWISIAPFEFFPTAFLSAGNGDVRLQPSQDDRGLGSCHVWWDVPARSAEPHFLQSIFTAEDASHDSYNH